MSGVCMSPVYVSGVCVSPVYMFGVRVAGGGAGTGWRVTGGHGRAGQGGTQVHERS